MRESKQLEIGSRFGKLVVIKRVRTEKYEGTSRRYTFLRYVCKCDCGISRNVRANNLLYGGTKSCGCSQVESACGEKKPLQEIALKELFSQYKFRAARRGIKFSLSREMFQSLVFGKCYYCSSELSIFIRVTRRKSLPDRLFSCNGVDRVNSFKGYVDGNVVSCCKNCNFAKRQLSVEEFYNWIEKVYSRRSEWAQLS